MPATFTKYHLVRTISVGGFLVVFLGGFLYFWTGAGGKLPVVSSRGQYEVSFVADDVKNLRPTGDVAIAGVVVGSVKDQKIEGERVHVTLSIDSDKAQLHEGATVRVGVKSVVGQSYVEIVDGDGAELGDGARIPDESVIAAVDVDELLSTFDPATRKALTGTIRSLAPMTKGSSEEMSQLMAGLGDLGREGFTAVDAVAAQSKDLEELVREATTLMNALDTGQGRIASVVKDAQLITDATAGESEALATTVRKMPDLLTSARTATGRLDDLGKALAPVASDLREASPYLNTALLQLPSVSRDLRGLVPYLDGTLDAAPATLKRVPDLRTDLHSLIPAARTMLKDVNPMISYLSPYGRDVGAMLASFGAAMDVVSENGIRPIRVAPIFNTRSVAGNPLSLAIDPLHWNNPYPAPGMAGDPEPFTGQAPRLERAK